MKLNYTLIVIYKLIVNWVNWVAQLRFAQLATNGLVSSIRHECSVVMVHAELTNKFKIVLTCTGNNKHLHYNSFVNYTLIWIIN